MSQVVAVPSLQHKTPLVRELTAPLRLLQWPLSLVLRLPVAVARFAAVRVLDATEDVVSLTTGARNRARKSPWMRDHWAPAPACAAPAEGLPVTGTLPPELDGAFMRVGPNPPRMPRSPMHLFDGDGAVAVFRVEGGEATFCFDYVQTEKLAAERAAGRERTENLGSIKGGYGIFHLLLNQARRAATGATWSKGPANTALAVHANKLMALHEGSMPYGLRVACDGALETLGRVLFDGKCTGPISAHPKVHPASGSLYSVSYNFGGAAGEKAAVHVVTRDGGATRTINLDLDHDDRPPPMMHDGQLTDRWVVVMDLSMVFRPENMGKGEDGGFPILFDKKRNARFGLLPVDATDAADMVWCELDEPLFIFHTAAAWDEGEDSVVLWGSTMDDLSLSLENVGDMYETQLNKFTLNTTTRTVTRERFPLPNWGYGTIPATFDFPTTVGSLPTTRRRFTYLVGMEQSRTDKVTPLAIGVGVVKFDMDTGREVGRLRFDAGTGAACGGECVFVPRAAAAGEDDGYLVTIVNGQDDGAAWSALAVYDARTMSAAPVAVVRAPQRVPLGFHALHVPLAQLRGLSRTAAC